MQDARRSPFHLALATLALLASAASCPAAPSADAESGRVIVCLAEAADGSPVYPLTAVPAGHRELFAVFRLGEAEAIQALTQVWTAVDVGDAAPAGTEIARGELAVKGQKHGTLRFTLPKDLPVGTYRLDVAADGKPWASRTMSVVATTPPEALGKPEDLLPLAVGTKWTYAFEVVPGPIVKNLSLPAAERGADGHWRSAASYLVAAAEPAGARVEMRRGDTLVHQEWWKLDATGFYITRQGLAGAEEIYDPPVPMLRLPLASPASWDHKSKDGALEMKYRAWGPLPVAGPKGPVPGFVVLSTVATQRGFLTVERHLALGYGIVRNTLRESVGPDLRVALDTRLAPTDK